MEDLYAAGGMGALLRELKPLLHLDCLTVTGETLGERLGRRGAAWSTARSSPRATSRSSRKGGLVALFGTLAPDGAILKRSAADPSAVRARGPRGGLHLARGSRRPHRRSRRSTSTPTTSWCCRTPARTRPRHAGGRLPADPEEARAGRRQGHGAHLGRAHERHRLRHHRAARHAGRGFRRPARRWCATATASGCRSRSGASTSWSRTRPQAPCRRGETGPEKPTRGYARLYAREILGADEGCDFAFLRPARPG